MWNLTTKFFFSKYASMPVFGKSKTTDYECLLIEDTIIEGVSINDRADKKDISMWATWKCDNEVYIVFLP